METDLASRIARALQVAGANRRLLPYQKFHALCGKEARLTERYAALDVAIAGLGGGEVDYGVLLACDNGLPGADFFQRFRKERPSEFVAIMGDPRFCQQRVSRKRELVALERERVYNHAATRAPHEPRRECA
jgi:hypothetical protein